ncbi:acyl transferase/acyl hydrolase/lysophospholipase [Xylariaceae sp. FL0804]|nr:acyl transferase/acyl hydrolase/lysophospholipase [Xylariaceae sp. FL0804]
MARLLVWTAADEKAIHRSIEGYNAYFKRSIASNQSDIDHLAYTLASRRSNLKWRTFAVVDPESSRLLTADPIRSKSNCAAAFVFAGQGAQYARMGLELLSFPKFQQTLQQNDSIYAALGCEWSLVDELQHEEHIDLPEYSQPLTTALQVALVELLESFGVVPAAVIGHSSGEIAAALQGRLL